MEETMATVVVTRERLVNPGRALQWLYSYRVNDGPTITYGTHLASLRSMLKRKIANVKIECAWKHDER